MSQVNIGLIDFLLVSPLLCLLFFSVIPLTIRLVKGREDLPRVATLYFSFMGLLGAFALIRFTSDTTPNPRPFFGNALIFDDLGVIGGIVLLIITGVTLFFLSDNVATKEGKFTEKVFLLLASMMGMFVLLWANDLIIMFIGIETMSLALYLLIPMTKEGVFSKEAALKYFILGSFASAIFLFGVAFVYGASGTTYLDVLSHNTAELMATNRLFQFGGALVILGFCFKVAIFPFHSWAPDVYQGASTPITAFMATAVKLVSFVAFLRYMVTQPLFGDGNNLLYILEWLAILTMIAGNVAAILQTNLKRLLAYSSIAHTGYAMIGLIAAGQTTQGMLGASSLIYYLVGYSIMSLGAFAIIMLFESDENKAVTLDDLKGLATRHPYMAATFTLFLLSMAGIPPTVGFFGKFYIFTAAIQEDLYWLAFWGVLNSVIAVYYYLRPVVNMYMKEGTAIVLPRHYLTRVTIAAAAILVIVLGFGSGPIIHSMRQSFAGLF